MKILSQASTRLRARRIAKIHGYEDARAGASRVLPRGLFDYVDGGAETEFTLRRNVTAFSELSFRPRMAVNNPAPNLATTVQGTPISMPVITAPCGGMRLVNPDGDIGIARAVARADTIHVTSSSSSFTLEEIAKGSSGPKWFQLYRYYSEEFMEQLVLRAEAAGYEALVVTVDTVQVGKREKDVKNGFSYDMRVSVRNALKVGPQLITRPEWVYRFWRDGMPFGLSNTASVGKQAAPLTAMGKTGTESLCPTWDDFEWLRKNWKGPLIIKGLLTPDDARRAVDAGCDGIVVSNHGGRQLESVPATIDVLPEIVKAVGEHCEILLDSGVRRGSDVLKALALGARAVLIGRSAVWGLATGGEAGVDRVLSILREDILRTMRLMGLKDVSDIDPSWLSRAGSSGPI